MTRQMHSRFKSHPSTVFDRSVLAKRPDLDDRLLDVVVGLSVIELVLGQLTIVGG